MLTSLAYLYHLFESGIVGDEVKDALKALLSALEDKIPLKGFEDVHEALEHWLLEKVGRAGGWLAYGKSRNDQVATALKLKTKRELIGVLWDLLKLRVILLDKAKGFEDKPMLLFTHLRPAQPSTLAHYLLYIEREASAHWDLIWEVLTREVDMCPLGSGPIAGSSVKLDRGRLAQLLGFSGVEENTLYATGSRTFINLALGALTSLMVFLSRVAEDLIVWSSPQFDYVSLPPEHVSTSSIMPQKRNPVTLEIVRAKASSMIGRLMATLSIQKGVGSGYSLDLQEVNPQLLNGLRDARSTVKVMSDLISKLEFNEERLREEATSYGTLAQDVAEKLTEKGMTYREAYSALASTLKLTAWDLEETSRRLDVKIPEINEVLMSRGRGGPNPILLKETINARRKKTLDDIGKLGSYEKRFRDALSSLIKGIKGIVEG